MSCWSAWQILFSCLLRGWSVEENLKHSIATHLIHYRLYRQLRISLDWALLFKFHGRTGEATTKHQRRSQYTHLAFYCLFTCPT